MGQLRVTRPLPVVCTHLDPSLPSCFASLSDVRSIASVYMLYDDFFRLIICGFCFYVYLGVQYSNNCFRAVHHLLGLAVTTAMPRMAFLAGGIGVMSPFTYVLRSGQNIKCIASSLPSPGATDRRRHNHFQTQQGCISTCGSRRSYRSFDQIFRHLKCAG